MSRVIAFSKFLFFTLEFPLLRNICKGHADKDREMSRNNSKKIPNDAATKFSNHDLSFILECSRTGRNEFVMTQNRSQTICNH